MALGTTLHRRTVTAAFAALAALSVTVVAQAPSARADDPTEVTIVGTTDVSDSNLMQGVLAPGFQAAFRQYKIKYVPLGTGDAITFARAGTAAGLLVHAASLENQFVADGYSQEGPGRALFWGDYVLVGPNNDPLGVKTSDPTDIVGAYEKIAAAGAMGNANYVSRGKAPGTTVAEHAIWANTKGVTTCTVTDANGGGQQPSTATGACQDPPTKPSWYQITNQGQAANLITTDQCSFSGGACYALTDRGTFVYQKAQGTIPDLQIVTQRAANASAQDTLLVNSFHGYVINPAKFPSDSVATTENAGAKAFLDWMTSAAGQKMIGDFENTDGNAPFLPDAAPTLTHSALPANVIGGKAFGVTGSLKNVVPGTPPLANVKVTLYDAPPAHPNARTAAASASTDANGNYHLVYTPLANRVYSVTSDPITQVEDSALNPPFSDALQPVSTGTIGSVNVTGSIKITSSVGSKGKLTVKGTVAPPALGSTARVALFGRVIGTSQVTHYISQVSLPTGATSFTLGFALPSNRQIFYQLRYANTGAMSTGGSFFRKVTTS